MPTLPAPPSPARRRNAFGFLRFALAAAVVYTHACYLHRDGPDFISRLAGGHTSAGSLAVGFFFALSGMLVAPSFRRTRHLAIYGMHRVLRIYPALILVVLFSVIVLMPLARALGPDQEIGWGAYAKSALEYVGRNLLVPNSLPRVSGTFQLSPVSDYANGSLWTLRYELMGYLGIGLLGMIGALDRRRVITGLLLVAAWVVHAHDAFMATAAERWFFTSEGKRMMLITLGGAAWAILPAAWQARLLHPASLAVLTLVTVGTIAIDQTWLLAPFAFPPLLHALGHALPLGQWERRVGGDYSYGMYLGHYPIQQTLVACGAAALSAWAFLGLSFLLTLGVAVLSWRLVESRALQAKDWRPGKPA